MSKRISEVQRVIAFFQNADEGAANVLFDVIKQIMASRFQKEKATRKPRQRKPPAAELRGAGSDEKIN